MDIEDAHPLRREAFIEDIWPCLKVCMCLRKARKPDFRAALKACLHQQMDIQVSKNAYSKCLEDE